jgi:hypothetical protein
MDLGVLQFERSIQPKRQGLTELRRLWSESIIVGMESGAGSDRFHDFFDVLFRALLDLLEFLVLAEFPKTSFNHVEEFVDISHKSCEFFTDLSRVQF